MCAPPSSSRPRPRPTTTTAGGTGSTRGDGVFSGDDIDEKVKLVGFAECLCDVSAGESAAFVGVGDDECSGCYFSDEDWRVVGVSEQARNEMGRDVLSHALQKRMGAGERADRVPFSFQLDRANTTKRGGRGRVNQLIDTHRLQQSST